MIKNGEEEEDRIDRLIETLSVQRPIALGHAHCPRRSTDPAVDAAAWGVALAIMKEGGQDPQGLFERYRLRVPVRADGRRRSKPSERTTAVAYEWDARRIINDRIWDWWRNHAHHRNNKDSRLGGGRMTVDVFYRCHSACQVEHANLLHAQAARITPCRLVACPNSGLAHLCRADFHHCHSRDQSDDTGIVCLESGRILREAGRATTHMSQNFDWGRREHSVMFGVGNHSSRMKTRRRFDASDPENARRVVAVNSLYRAGCPHIVSWEPAEGELILDLTLDPDRVRAQGQVPFDPTFLWTAAPTTTTRSLARSAPATPSSAAASVGPRTRSDPGPPSSLSLPPSTPASTLAPLPSKQDYMTQMLRESETRRKQKERANRSRRSAQARRRQRSRDSLAVSSGGGGRLAGSLEDRERATIERVLDDVLWDANTRRNINAAARPMAVTMAQQALARRMDGPAARAVATKPGTTTTTAPQQSGAASRRRRRRRGRPRAAPAVVSSLLLALAKRSDAAAQPTPSPAPSSSSSSSSSSTPHPKAQVMTLGRLAQTTLHAVRDALVPVAPLDSVRHKQLTLAISYLWGFVLHEPPQTEDPAARGAAGMESDPSCDSPEDHGGAGGGNDAEQEPFSAHRGVAPLLLQKRRRRDTDTRAATLAQFTLGFLYTAAVSGVDVGGIGGWPRDWWLYAHLPAVKSLHHYGGAARCLVNSNRVGRGAKATQTTAGDRLMAGLVHTTTRGSSGADGCARPPWMPPRAGGAPRDVRVYQMKDITAGKRALSAAVRNYRGSIPTAQEAAAYLGQRYTHVHSRGLGGGKRARAFTLTAAFPGKTGRSAAAATTTQGHRRNGLTTRYLKSSTALLTANGGSQSSEQQQQQQRRRRGKKRKTPSASVMQQQQRVHVAKGDGAVRFCSMFVSAGRSEHVCVTFNPFSAQAPPGLSPQTVRREQWKLDTVVGPFIVETLARKFCVEWARIPCTDVTQRRIYGVKLARQVGLEAWQIPQAKEAPAAAPPPPPPAVQQPLPNNNLRRHVLVSSARAARARQMFAAMQAMGKADGALPAASVRSTAPVIHTSRPQRSAPPRRRLHQHQRMRARGSGALMSSWSARVHQQQQQRPMTPFQKEEGMREGTDAMILG